MDYEQAKMAAFADELTKLSMRRVAPGAVRARLAKLKKAKTTTRSLDYFPESIKVSAVAQMRTGSVLGKTFRRSGGSFLPEAAEEVGEGLSHAQKALMQYRKSRGLTPRPQARQ
jgi:hypothetical protein